MPDEANGDSLSPEGEVELYFKMCLIRAVEEHVVSAASTGLVPGSTHVSIGQEAITVGACSALDPKDLMLATYRGHGAFLANGGDIKELMAEIMLREPGCCAGKGGTMHLSDPEHGTLLTSAIVASQIPIAGGVALGCKLRNTGQVVMTFFGDGAACEGEFFETMNMAKIWNIPLVMVCENNGYALATPISKSQATPDIADRAKGFDMPAEIVDGNDVIEVRNAVARAVNRARSDGGPTLIECKTVRYGMHSTRSPGYYDNKEDANAWRDVDPIPRFRAALIEREVALPAALEEAEARAKMEALDAREFAQAAPLTSIETIRANVFAE